MHPADQRPVAAVHAALDCGVLLRAAAPRVVDERDRIGLLHLVIGQRQVLGPEVDAQLGREFVVLNHDVEFGVGDEAAIVQVGGAHRQPLVIDDRHLGMDVHRPIAKGLHAGTGAGGVQRVHRNDAAPAIDAA